MKTISHTIAKRMALGLAFCLPLTAPMQALAHRQFLLPTSTIVTGNAPWVSFDAAAASDVFYFDHVPLNLSNLMITAADGSSGKAENQSTGKFRSSFDVQTQLVGTYKVSLVNDNLSASYKENGNPKRWRGSVEAFAKEVPANAEGLQVTHMQGRVETFITNGKPNTAALKPSGKGLELAAITHPNDLVEGEAAQFRLLLDGKPLAGASVTVLAGGIRYRQKLNEQSFTSDQDGKLNITWQGAGMYWLGASHTDKNVGLAAAKERRTSYVATLEVMPQ